MKDETQEKQHSLFPAIAIVGRPNVGKSSLFNAILKKRCAIVHFDSGVTRDRVSSMGLFEGRRFRLIDTGGLGMGKGEKRGVDFWDQSIEQQVEAAIDDADVILFVVDVTCGLASLDQEVAKRLPNYNCGSCGYAGCRSMAEAIVAGKEQNIKKCKQYFKF